MIYLDYQASTPIAPEAREAMLRWLGGSESLSFGNPHSSHQMGRMAAAAIELAREQILELFPAGGKVIFTSGATEALNLAIRGVGLKGTFCFSAGEHSAVSDTMKSVGKGHLLKVDRSGLCDPDQEMPSDTSLVAVMQINNEIGVIQPSNTWYSRAKEIGALYICDAVQAYGKLNIANADMIAVSAHKLHGPKGIGALWIRDGVQLNEIQTGGGQECGLRSGTMSPALIAGFGAAAALAKDCMEEDALHVRRLWARARELFSGWTINGSVSERWLGNINMRLEGLDVARLMSNCRDVMFSAGSACASGSGRPSHVLQSIGLSREQIKNSIRLGYGRYTSLEDLETAALRIRAAVREQGL